MFKNGTSLWAVSSGGPLPVALRSHLAVPLEEVVQALMLDLLPDVRFVQVEVFPPALFCQERVGVSSPQL